MGAVWVFKYQDVYERYEQLGEKLVGSDYIQIPPDRLLQGLFSARVSSDTSTVAFGALGDNAGRGATWIFKYDTSSGYYRQFGPKLVGVGDLGGQYFNNQGGNPLAFPID